VGEKPKGHVTMRVRIGDRELEVTGPMDYVESKIAEFASKQKDSASSPPQQGSVPLQPNSAPTGQGKPVSVAQFFKTLNLGSDVDRALAAGFYLEKHSGAQSFTAAEMKDTVQKAKIPPPRNPSDAIAKNIRKGLMMTAGDKEGKLAYVLTTDGEEALSELTKSE